MAPAGHDCPVTDLVLEQHKRIEQLLARAEKQDRELAQLKKSLFGPKSERSKMPSVESALGKEAATQEERTARRREHTRKRDELPTVVLEHRVPDNARRVRVRSTDRPREQRNRCYAATLWTRSQSRRTSQAVANEPYVRRASSLGVSDGSSRNAAHISAR